MQSPVPLEKSCKNTVQSHTPLGREPSYVLLMLDKFNISRRRPGRWYFGISQSSAHKCLIVPVASRDEKTLGDIIKKHVDNSCSMKIVSDGWASYRKIKEWGYDHSVVIHKSEFKNSAGDHTKSLESIWSQLKTWIDSMHGLKADCYDHYISEFLYRYNFCGGSKSNWFDRFMSDLKKLFAKEKSKKIVIVVIIWIKFKFFVLYINMFC